MNHQEFQVPKMEVLNRFLAILVVGFSLHKPNKTAYISEYLNFRYLKCLVNESMNHNLSQVDMIQVQMDP